MQRKYGFWVVSLLILIIGTHVIKLADIPAGLYVDETSIGYNAALISQSGFDEHHTYYPVYFKAFGEYKNPIYIYAVALIFKIFGISDFTLRITSFIFYMAALIFTALLISRSLEETKGLNYTRLYLSVFCLFFLHYLEYLLR